MTGEQRTMEWEPQLLFFRKALAKLTVAVEILKPGEEENLELEEIDVLLKDGLIRRFEYTFEIAWNLMKKYAWSHGNNTVNGPENSIHAGVKMGLIASAEGWLAMLESRKESSIRYDEESTDAIFQKVMEAYYLLFLKFEDKMVELCSGI